MSNMTDEQAVKGPWPDATEFPTGIWEDGQQVQHESAWLGRDWHESRQHPSVVEWEAYQHPHSKPIDASPISDLEATIAEQAARIEELRKLVAFWEDRMEARLTHLVAAEARVAELEKWHTQSARLVDAYKERAERAEVELEKAGRP